MRKLIIFLLQACPSGALDPEKDLFIAVYHGLATLTGEAGCMHAPAARLVKKKNSGAPPARPEPRIRILKILAKIQEGKS